MTEDKDIGGGWTAHKDGESYLSDALGSSRMDLPVALLWGMLKAVRAERGQTQLQAALAIDVTPNIVARWERGEVTPTGLYRKALERYLIGEE